MLGAYFNAASVGITGVGLDGTIIYGLYEAGTAAPADLDACNGHTGPVPVDDDYGLAAGTVYHYHMTDGFPHTIGCYGPVASEVRRRRARNFLTLQA